MQHSKYIRSEEKHQHWLLIEPTAQGHHAIYLGELVRHALRIGIQVTVGTAQDAHSTELAKILAELNVLRSIRYIEVKIDLPRSGKHKILDLVKAEFAYRQFFHCVYERACTYARPDYVFVPYLDYALLAIGLLGSPFGSTRFGGISMRQRFHLPVEFGSPRRSWLNWLKRGLFMRALRIPTLSSVLAIDSTLVEYCNTHQMAGRNKVRFISDPVTTPKVTDPQLARKRYGLEKDEVAILVYGSIVARKGIAELINWASTGGNSSKVVLLLCGVATEDAVQQNDGHNIAKLLQNKRLQQYNYFHDENEESYAFGAANYVWLGYKSFELMSGVLAKASMLNKKVIANRYGLIARYCERYGVLNDVTKREESSLGLPSKYRIVHFPSTQRVIIQEHTWDNAFREVVAGTQQDF